MPRRVSGAGLFIRSTESCEGEMAESVRDGGSRELLRDLKPKRRRDGVWGDVVVTDTGVS